MKASKETIYFLIAVFALLLAGDAIWWQSVQLAMDYDSTQWNPTVGGGPDTLRASIYRQAELNQRAAQETE